MTRTRGRRSERGSVDIALSGPGGELSGTDIRDYLSNVLSSGHLATSAGMVLREKS